jgi:hypothetical protein
MVDAIRVPLIKAASQPPTEPDRTQIERNVAADHADHSADRRDGLPIAGWLRICWQADPVHRAIAPRR